MSMKLRALCNFLEGAGLVLDISGRDPIPPSEFIGFETGHDTFMELKRDYNNICQDMSKAWYTVRENSPASLPHDKQKER